MASFARSARLHRRRGAIVAEIPDWLTDELRPASATAFRLAIVICVKGVPLVLPGAERRIYLRHSVDDLGAIAGTKRTATMAALRELEGLGIIRRHRAGRMRQADGVSIGFDPPFHSPENGPRETGRQGGITQFGVVPVSGVAVHSTENGLLDRVHSPENGLRQVQGPEVHSPENGLLQGVDVLDAGVTGPDLPGGSLRGDRGSSNTNKQGGSENGLLAAELREIGVVKPAEWLREFSVEQIEAGLDYLAQAQRKGQWIRNPAGWLRSILASPAGVPAGGGDSIRDSPEKRRRYYHGEDDSTAAQRRDSVTPGGTTKGDDQ